MIFVTMVVCEHIKSHYHEQLDIIGTSLMSTSEIFTQALLNNGYKVYVADQTKDIYKNTTYFYVVKGNNICYVEAEYFSGLKFSSVYMGGRSQGSGAVVYKEVIKPTLKHIDNSFNKSYGKVEYWKSWEQYTERNKQFNPYVEVRL